ncbi:MAG: hypothetical protein CMG59_02660 [Candidatus Marinimicrobia bacterium]|nr:hypothetical protein [Candidatus Neomarinimicrobiota bacterium]|tara:strand:- start:9065 stop:9706 length:642 start_codon:yes stop_codon:yes gene_type:complete
MYNTNIKALLFDMDGVTIDSEKLYSKTEPYILKKYGINFDQEDWSLIKGCTEKQFYDHVFKKFSPKIDRNTLINESKDFLKKIFSQELVYMNGFKQIHDKYREKYKFILVTSTGPELMNHIDKVLSIRKMFDFTFDSSDTDKHKPDPEPYLNAINKLGLASSECVVIEDSIQGVSSGKAAGCFVVALLGTLDEKLLKEADMHISSLHELSKIL